jgi:hypothetical protein
MSFFRRFCVTAALAPVLLLVAGCGVQLNGMNSAGLLISSPSASVSTTGQLRFKATLPDGSPAAVSWAVTSSQTNASMGIGSIDEAGLYTPPNALASDGLSIQITARLQSDPSRSATNTITVTPGFLQSLLPKNAALTAGASLEISAQIAEVGGGSVHWGLSDSNAGALGPSTCSRGPRQYTVCRVMYTAPSLVPAQQSVHVIATVNDTATQSQLHLLLNNSGVNSNALANQSTQSGPVVLGASGSNDTDYDVYKDSSGNSYIADCCGGTLGALVEDSAHNQYILSNNHVLAESDQAKVGDTIDLPGLIDNACRPLTSRPVGTLKYFVPLASPQTNVDAALASVVPGAVSPDGSILQFGTQGTGMNASLGSAPPMAGTGELLTADNLSSLRVVKSGRTTGLTCSTVETVNLNVKVDYYKDCAETQAYYTKTFTGQIGISGDNFSDSGDSGSLVVNASNAQAIGLFYAGGTDGDGNGLSVVNPISDVLNELGAETGSKLSIVGTHTPHSVACLDYDKNIETPPALPALSATAQTQASNATLIASVALVNHEKGILGVAAGKSADGPGDPAVIVYVDKNNPNTAVPKTIADVRTVVVPTDAASVANDSAPKLPATSPGIHLSAGILNAAKAVVDRHASQLMSDPAIFGVGVAQSHDDSREAALLVLIDMDRMPKSMPATIGGLRVRYMRLHRFHVTKSKYADAHPVSSCSLKSGN